MKRSAQSPTYDVGYKKPPEKTQFQKGRSGNPSGRPKKSAKAPESDDLSDGYKTILKEFNRTIEIREDGRLKRMTVLQATLRSVGLNAIKGDIKSQRLVLDFYRAAEDGNAAKMEAAIKSAVEFKNEWEAKKKECELTGEPLPDPVPHPDDIVIDARRMEVRFNGPVDEGQRAQWKMMLERKAEAEQELAELTEELKSHRKNPDPYVLDDIALCHQIIDVTDMYIPDEQTRRVPGFDIDEWRKSQKRSVQRRQARRLRQSANDK